MISVDKIVGEINLLKMSSEELSYMLNGAGQDLKESTNIIANIVKGSRTGQEAVTSLSIASQSLLVASASIINLCRTCDKCVSELTK